MRRTLTVLGAVALVSILAGGAALASERWIHVRVEEWDHDGERVSVNVPLQMIEAMLPMIETDMLRDGKVQLHHHDLDGIDLRQMLAALQDAPDAEFVTVQTNDEEVRVAKESGYLKVLLDDRRGEERVRVKVPLAVVDALLGSDPEQLDLAAGLRRLAEFDGDLVTVESDEGNVRVWIDSSQTGE